MGGSAPAPQDGSGIPTPLRSREAGRAKRVCTPLVRLSVPWPMARLALSPGQDQAPSHHRGSSKLSPKPAAGPCTRTWSRMEAFPHGAHPAPQTAPSASCLLIKTLDERCNESVASPWALLGSSSMGGMYHPPIPSPVPAPLLPSTVSCSPHGRTRALVRPGACLSKLIIAGF